MKILHSQIKKYLPNLTLSIDEIAQAFTFTGQMLDKKLAVKYLDKDDWILDLEVRQNRADLFSTIGLVQELSVYSGESLNLPSSYTIPTTYSTDQIVPITITSKDHVKRVKAFKICNIQIGKSPQWLVEYLNLFDINSINNLVDLTNYIMLETGIPSHVFDTDLVGDSLVWEMAGEKYKYFTTLAGNQISIDSDTLVISDGKRPLSLSFIGGAVDAVNANTKNIILEFGIYDQSIVRKNSREFKIITEAGNRLEKYLDYRIVNKASSMLLEMIKEICNGEVVACFDWVNKELETTQKITLRPQLVRQISGVDITNEFMIKTLTKLGFEPKKLDEDLIECVQALGRTDVTSEYDLIEEVVRFYGYNKIPSDKLIINPTKDITPSRINLMEKIEDWLSNSGFDEVRSWVLVDEELNKSLIYNGKSNLAIRVTNSINEEVPILRTSLAVSLLQKYESMFANGIEQAMLFEIGKIFYNNEERKHNEEYFLGLLVRLDKDSNHSFNYAINVIYSILSFLGLNYSKLSIINVNEQNLAMAHRNSIFEILYQDISIGRIFVTSKFKFEPGEVVVSEISIEKVDKIIKQASKAIELNTRIISRDFNIYAMNDIELSTVVGHITEEFKDLIFHWQIIDKYTQGNTNKYTVRFNLLQLSNDFEGKVEQILARNI
jgi:phenylalanyl-tRNA synthetase beta subunit